MEVTFKLTGMSCEACEKLVRKAADEAGATVTGLSASEGWAKFEASDGKLLELEAKLSEKGFNRLQEGEVRGDFKRFFAFLNDVAFGKLGFENSLFSSSFAGGFSSLLVSVVVLLSLIKPSSRAVMLPVFVLLSLSSALVSFSYFHLLGYRKKMSCTSGMMAGMTLGMVSGFLFGAVSGATNGMFVGSTLGSLVGMALGFLVGRFCGVMGVMEGMMAGLMGGTMGAMLSVMMISDHLIEFLFFLFFACAAITVCLAYMMRREAGEPVGKPTELNLVAFVSVALSVLFISVALLAPKAGLVLG
jgi:hypothetical protein